MLFLLQYSYVDRRFLLIEAFISQSTSSIARECHKKLTDHNNFSYKPEMKWLGSAQTTPLAHAPRVNDTRRHSVRGKSGLSEWMMGSGT